MLPTQRFIRASSPWCEPTDYVPLEDLLQPGALLLALDEVTDPRNFGAMLRSLEAFGGTGAIITRRRSARLGPTVTKTSAGASEILPVAMVTNLGQTLDKARKLNMQIIAADFGGIFTDSNRLDAAHNLGGGRRRGQGFALRFASAPTQLRASQWGGRTASLNAAVATGVILHCAHLSRGV